MTARELRQILTEIGEQEMTVRDLRAALYEIEEQDEEIEARTLRRLGLQNKQKEGNDGKGNAQD